MMITFISLKKFLNIVSLAALYIVFSQASFAATDNNMAALVIEENAAGFCSADGLIESNHTGFTGEGFVNSNNELGAGVEWAVNAPATDRYILEWGYALAGTEGRSGRVLVNGAEQSGNVAFPASGAWTSYTSTTTEVNLVQGNNRIKLEAIGTEGLANIDYIKVSGPEPAAGNCKGGIGIEYTLATNSQPANGGTITLDPAGGVYAPGTVVTVTATPWYFHVFDGWSSDVTSSAASIEVIMNGNKELVASFVKDDTANLLGTTYYVSNDGNDANDGSISSPFRTISRVNQLSLTPGDAVLFRKGDRFPGQLTVNGSGTAAENIYIGAYGTGDKPELVGGAPVTDWTVHSGDIYKTRISQPIGVLVANEGIQQLARHPNNKQWFYGDQSGPLTNFVDRDRTGDTNWKGATLLLNQRLWNLDPLQVSSFNSGTGTFVLEKNLDLLKRTDIRYSIINHMAALDSPGEWYYDKDTGTLYYWAPNNQNPNDMDIYGSTEDYGVVVGGNDVTLEGLDINGYSKAGVYFTNKQRVRILNNDISNIRLQGVYSLFGAGHHVISGNNIKNTGLYGILAFEGGNSVIEHNEITHIATIPNHSTNGVGGSGGVGIRWSGGNTTYRYNKLKYLAYSGISYSGQNNIIEKNVIKYMSNVNTDVGAIYSYAANYESQNGKGTVIRNNIIIGGIDEKTPYPDDSKTHGIYQDNRITGVLVENNFVANVRRGVLMNTTRDITVRNNLFYNSRETDVQISNAGWGGQVQEGDTYNNQVTGNKGFRLHADQGNITIRSEWSSWRDAVTFNQNYYYNPYRESPAYLIAPEADQTYGLSEWRSTSGFDSNSKVNDFRWTAGENYSTYITNETDEAVQVPVTGIWTSFEGEIYEGSIELEPFEGKIIWLYDHGKVQATQSSTRQNDVASKAIDLNTDGVHANGSVTHTNAEVNPWWQLDMGSNRNIAAVTLFNRTDCCSDRLTDVYVFLSEANLTGRSLENIKADSQVVQVFTAGELPARQTLTLNGKGRYLRVQLGGTGILSLAEVQVRVEDEDDDAPAALPNYELNSGKWSLISIPADPASTGTVQAVFGDDLPVSEYGSNWLIYAFDSAANQYRLLALDELLEANRGYWIFQRVADPLFVDAPGNLPPLRGIDQSGCLDEQPCVSIELTSNSEFAVWNMVGYSSARQASFGETRFVTASGDCAQGCTPDEALKANVAQRIMYRFNGESAAYESVTDATPMQPWDGYWLLALPGADKLRWVVPAESGTTTSRASRAINLDADNVSRKARTDITLASQPEPEAEIENQQSVVVDDTVESVETGLDSLHLHTSNDLENIFDLLNLKGNYTTLIELLEITGLADALRNLGDRFTLFAPADDAFALLGEEAINSLRADVESTRRLLLYHVLGGRAFDVVDLCNEASRSIISASGDTLNISCAAVDTFINSSRIVDAGNIASNGILHRIDSLLSLADVVTQKTLFEVIRDDGKLNTLTGLLISTGLDAMLSDAKREFTLLAPTDTAFANLEQATLDKLAVNPDLLLTLLRYHVIDGQSMDANSLIALDGQSIVVVNGASVSLSITGGLLFVDDSKFARSDIPAVNGVAHAIHRVLIPDGMALAEDSLWDRVASDERLGKLRRLLLIHGLDQRLRDIDAQFTAFLPSDDAFEYVAGKYYEDLESNRSKAETFLNNHLMYDENYDVTGMIEVGAVSTSLGSPLTIKKHAGRTYMQYQRSGRWMNAQIKQADLRAVNGTAHIINYPLLP